MIPYLAGTASPRYQGMGFTLTGGTQMHVDVVTVLLIVLLVVLILAALRRM